MITSQWAIECCNHHNIRRQKCYTNFFMFRWQFSFCVFLHSLLPLFDVHILAHLRLMLALRPSLTHRLNMLPANKHTAELKNIIEIIIAIIILANRKWRTKQPNAVHIISIIRRKKKWSEKAFVSWKRWLWYKLKPNQIKTKT